MPRRCQRCNIKTPGNVLRNLRETLEKNWRGRRESQRVLMMIMNTVLKKRDFECNARERGHSLQEKVQ